MGREERRIRRQGRGGGGDELARGRPGTVRTPPIILFSLPRFASLSSSLSLSPFLLLYISLSLTHTYTLFYSLYTILSLSFYLF